MKPPGYGIHADADTQTSGWYLLRKFGEAVITVLHCVEIWEHCEGMWCSTRGAFG